jgi:putative peptidoglycan lipid II flippase
VESVKIARSATGIGIATLGSRILGFLRDVLIANFFGTGVFAQTFFAAFRIPNLMRRLFGEGALSASFIPVFTEELSGKGKDSAWDLAISVFNSLALVLAGIVLAGMIFSPLITRMIVPGFADTPGKIELTSRLLRIMFPYLFFIALAALMMGVLNSLRHFAAPALAPIILNVSMITFLIFFVRKVDEPVIGLAIAVIIGGVGQLGIQMVTAIKKGMPIGRKFILYHPLVKKIALLMLPAALGAGIYQINIFVDGICASYESIVGKGAIAALWYANRLMQFPLAIFGLAVATAIFPQMAVSSSKNDLRTLGETVSFGLRTVFLLMIPSAIGLIILRRPIISILFERNEFGSYSTEITSTALLYYCVGLFAYAGVHILSKSFYSLQDMKTPVKVASLAMAANIILNLALMRPLKVGGLSLATSISSIMNLCLLSHLLRKRIGSFEGRKIMFSCLRVIAASAIMGFLLWAVKRSLPPVDSSLKELANLLILILTGSGSFIIMCLLFKVNELKILKKAFSKA